MTDYHILYENIILAAWGKTWKREDPFKLADAGTLSSADNELSGENGHEAKFGLSTALRKVAADNENTALKPMLLDLDRKLWRAKDYNEVCQILEKTKTIFESTGLHV